MRFLGNRAILGAKNAKKARELHLNNLFHNILIKYEQNKRFSPLGTRISLKQKFKSFGKLSEHILSFSLQKFAYENMCDSSKSA